jgi:diguanylate cyclase (GGDEF)-like protein
LRQKNRQLEEMLQKVEILAITDPLTELFNRRRFEAVLDKEFSRSVRYDAPLSCLMIDIDHFKKVNDEFGHHTGDLVLKEVAQLLRSNARDVDTVARWGGEEFVILLPQTKKESGIAGASRILKIIGGHEFPGIEKAITVSIGIAGVPDPSIDSGEKLINACDLALYEAKRKGRNRVESA